MSVCLSVCLPAVERLTIGRPIFPLCVGDLLFPERISLLVRLRCRLDKS